MPPPPGTAPTLPDELVEEIFLRLPPDDPACLVRASLASKLCLGLLTGLASKLCLGLLTGAAFRGRYADFHGAPPMLGFLLSWLRLPRLHQEKDPATHFVSTAKFGPRIPDKYDWDSLDSHHGRVLLADDYAGFSELAVWDPVTGYWRQLQAPVQCNALGAAVLCAVTGCDHRACHDGPFQVLLFGRSFSDMAPHSAHAWVFSSETGEWTEPCSPLQLGSEDTIIPSRPSLLFQNALYRTVYYPDHIAILKYDIGSNCMSLLQGPPLEGGVTASSAVLVAMEDDSLGFTCLDYLSLYRWSRQIRSDGVATWTRHRIVDLKELIPIQNPENELRLIGFKEGSGIVFVTMDLGIYEINLKTLEWKKLWKSGEIRALIPYMSFYNPAERATTPSAPLRRRIDNTRLNII